jgi:hypothetical protein
MPYNEAYQFVLDNIEALNSKYSGDPFYDNLSEKSGGYFRKMKYTMDNLKPKTTQKLIEYLSNAMQKGMNIRGENDFGSITLAEILSDKELLNKTASLLSALADKE